MKSIEEMSVSSHEEDENTGGNRVKSDKSKPS